MKFSIRKLRIWSHLQKKSLMENFIFCAMSINSFTNFERSLVKTLIDMIPGNVSPKTVDSDWLSQILIRSAKMHKNRNSKIVSKSWYLICILNFCRCFPLVVWKVREKWKVSVFGVFLVRVFQYSDWN